MLGVTEAVAHLFLQRRRQAGGGDLLQQPVRALQVPTPGPGRPRPTPGTATRSASPRETTFLALSVIKFMLVFFSVIKKASRPDAPEYQARSTVPFRSEIGHKEPF